MKNTVKFNQKNELIEAICKEEQILIAKIEYVYPNKTSEILVFENVNIISYYQDRITFSADNSCTNYTFAIDDEIIDFLAFKIKDKWFYWSKLDYNFEEL